MLVTIEVPARDGRPARTFQGRVDRPLDPKLAEPMRRVVDKIADDLIAAHPTWPREIAVAAAVSVILERLDDLDTYERVCAERGLLPL